MGRSIPRLVFPLLALCAVCAASREVKAEGEITVARGEGAESCPDAAELQRIASASHAPASTTHGYRVTFERTATTFRAEIVDETTKRIRRLIDRGARCAPLGDAVAVVLATMWGSERMEESPEPAPQVPPPQPPPPPVLPREASPPPSLATRTHWIAGAGGGIAAGLVRPIAPALIADIALERAWFAMALGVLWIPDQAIDLSPGTVHVQLAAANVRGCAFFGRDTRLGLCARFFAGALDARGTGYEVSSHETRPWLAGGLDVFLGGALPITTMRYRLSTSAIVPIHAEAFSVSGVGTAYETPAIGGLVTLSIEVGTR